MTVHPNRNAQPNRFTSHSTGRGLTLIALLALPCAGAGCHPRSTRFEVVDYSADGAPARYYEEFDECFYDLDAQGNIEIVARRKGSMGPDDQNPVTQVVHLSSIWRAVPGTTEVESTQLNATIKYWIRGPSGGVGFEGAGFVLFQENYKRETLTGELELSNLRLTRQVGTSPLLFEQMELTGAFRATRNKRWAVRITNEMERYFGPMPRYEPAPPGPI